LKSNLIRFATACVLMAASASTFASHTYSYATSASSPMVSSRLPGAVDFLHIEITVDRALDGNATYGFALEGDAPSGLTAAWKTSHTYANDFLAGSGLALSLLAGEGLSGSDLPSSTCQIEELVICFTGAIKTDSQGQIVEWNLSSFNIVDGNPTMEFISYYTGDLPSGPADVYTDVAMIFFDSNRYPDATYAGTWTNVDNDAPPVSSVPDPAQATMLIFGLGLLCLKPSPGRAPRAKPSDRSGRQRSVTVGG